MDLDELAGEELLNLLLSKVRGWQKLPGAESIHVLEADVRCRVPGCQGSAIFRCTTGWRYCAKHVRVHGPDRQDRHAFDIITSSRPKDVREAEETLAHRIQARDFLPDGDAHAS
jgi:hypothetical protein